jgi:hypothetical protein
VRKKILLIIASFAILVGFYVFLERTGLIYFIHGFTAGAQGQSLEDSLEKIN